MSNASLPLTALRVFESAARLLSFTRAAEELGMTQAAVSYQIKVLEERVGSRLFLRQPRQVALTEVGERLAPALTDAFAKLRLAYDDARGETRSLLTISSVATFASNWLAPRLGLFQLKHPNVAVRLDTDPRNRDFSREDVDIGIRGGFGKWPGVSAHRLMPITFAPMVSPLLIERLGPIERPEDLLRLPIVDPTDPWWPIWFKGAGLADPDLSGLSATHTGSQAFEAMVALSGHGVAILTPPFFTEALRNGTLIQPFEHVGSDGQDYWLVHAESRARVTKIKAFRDWVLDQFASETSSMD